MTYGLHEEHRLDSCWRQYSERAPGELTLRQRVDARVPRPRFRVRRRHAVALAVAVIFFLGAMRCAWWLNRAM